MAGVARPPRVDADTHRDVEAWLLWEAELLDGRRFRDWLSLVADDVDYVMPVTVTRSRGTAPGGNDMDHLNEDRYTLEKRVERLEGDHAWTEDPPSGPAASSATSALLPVRRTTRWWSGATC